MMRRDAAQAGFTLIELMVSLVVAMVILAGLYGSFIMQSRVQAGQASVAESAEDLRLAAQIMRTQLRMAVNMCWDSANLQLVYQPLGSPVTMTGCSGTMAPSWGAFQFQTSASTGGELMWLRPNFNPTATAPYTAVEVLRGLDPTQTTGFDVSYGGLGGLTTVKLTSQYQDMERQNKDLSVSFDVLPRNN